MPRTLVVFAKTGQYSDQIALTAYLPRRPSSVADVP
jgi:hypothetical protein